MLESILILAASVTAAVEFARTMLLGVPGFTALTDTLKSLILQALAFVFGILAAVSAGVNIFAALPPFSALSPDMGIVLTGLIAGTGTQAIHVILALLAARGSNGLQAQSAKPSPGYLPFS